MSKKTKSQWDFGELFPVEQTQPAKPRSGENDFKSSPSPQPSPPGEGGEKDVIVSQGEVTAWVEITKRTEPQEAGRRVLTVGELTSQVRRLLEAQVGEVWVTGEVTNFRAQGSGHIYFTLKDAESQLSCVLFRNEARESRGLVKDGQKLVLRGDVTVYEARGQYQLRVTAVELQGVGALQLAFERLKQKLNAEGLFAPERKGPLPGNPQRTGLVTSPTGAAIKDVLHVVRRRNPGLEIILAPCRVQGQGAAEEIAEAIRLLNDCGLRIADCGFGKGQPTVKGGDAGKQRRPLTPTLSPDGGEGEDSEASK